MVASCWRVELEYFKTSTGRIPFKCCSVAANTNIKHTNSKNWCRIWFRKLFSVCRYFFLAALQTWSGPTESGGFYRQNTMLSLGSQRCGLKAREVDKLLHTTVEIMYCHTLSVNILSTHTNRFNLRIMGSYKSFDWMWNLEYELWDLIQSLPFCTYCRLWIEKFNVKILF